VVQRGRRGAHSGTWVPIVPKDAAVPGAPATPPTAVKAFVYTDRTRDPEEIYRLLSNPQLAGMITNKVKTPNNRAEDELQSLFPQTDFSTCIFIEEGREPASELTSMLLIIGGIAAVLIGIACLGLCLLLWRKNATKAEKKKGRFRDEYDDEDRPRKRHYLPDEDAPRHKRHRADDSEDEDRPRRRSRPRDEEEPPPRRRRPESRTDDDYEDRPRRRPRRDDD
jgi:hypothetical protein